MRLALLLTLLLLIPLAAPAAEHLPLDRVVAAVEAPFRLGDAHALRGLSAEFQQTSRIAALDQEQAAAGTLWLQFQPAPPADGLPARFRWVYRQPTEQLFVSDGLTIWVWLPETKQVVQSDAAEARKSGAENPVTLLTGLGQLSRDFTIAWEGAGRTNDGDYRLQLTPRSPSPYLARLQLTVDGALVRQPPADGYFPLKGLTVEDENGNRTTIAFDRIVINPELDASRFRFVPPADAEIVHPEDLAPGR